MVVEQFGHAKGEGVAQEYKCHKLIERMMLTDNMNYRTIE